MNLSARITKVAGAAALSVTILFCMLAAGTPSTYAASSLTVGGKALVSNTDGGTVRVRSGAGTSNDQVAEAHEGETVTILAGPKSDSDGNSWYKIDAPGGTGWVISDYLSSAGSSSSKQSSSSLSGTAKIANTDGGTVRVRSGAGTSNDQVAEAHEGEVVTILAGPKSDSDGNSWYKIDAPGGTGWVISDYLASAGSSSSSSSSKSSTTSTKQAGSSLSGAAKITNTSGDTVRIRSGAGTSNDQVGEAHEGDAVTVLAGPKSDGNGSNWYKVQAPGGTGWVVSDYLVSAGSSSSSSSSKSSTTSSTTKQAAASSSSLSGSAEVTNTSGDTIRIRSGAGTSNDQVGQAQEGDVVTIVSGPKSDGSGTSWYKVQASGGTGWIAADYLAPAPASSASKSSTSSKPAASAPKITGFAKVANTDGDPLRLRTAPNRNGDVTTMLAPGTVMAVKEGPATDSENIVWYKVSANGSTGWVMAQYLAQTKAPDVAPAPVAQAAPQPAQQQTQAKAQTQPKATTKSTTPAIQVQPAPTPLVDTQAVARTGTSRGAQAPAQVASTSSSKASSIVSVAMKYVGYPYVFGGTTPRGFDCSGFVYYVTNHAGISMSRDMYSQLNSGPQVSLKNLQPGDLLFFVNTYKAGLSHAGIYIGNGKMVHAENESTGVAVSDLYSSYWMSHYYTAVRPVN